MVEDGPWQSHRHRTAIGRADLSKPLRMALQDGVLQAGHTVLDYGCGRGQDVQRLQRMGFEAAGWDPYFNPEGPRDRRDIVMLSYVLNVIEDPRERESTLAEAWKLAQIALVVSCRLNWERGQIAGTDHGDGVLTSRSTFQHLFSTRELKEFVQAVTGEPCVSPMPGMVYAFRKAEDRLSFLAKDTVARYDWSASVDVAMAIGELVSFAESRGRIPIFEEIPDETLSFIGHLSRKEISRLVHIGADPRRIESGAKRAILDTLLYLGTSIFNGRPNYSELPISVREDIRTHFRSYHDACARADRLLLKLRDDTYIRGAMTNSPGKLTATALYVHRRATSTLPVVLRLYEHCGYVAAGRPDDWNILKLDHRGRRVSWSSYPNFDSDPHPKLARTYGVQMSTLESSFQDFSQRANRPLLHRKEEFLSPDDPLTPKFRRLTASEVRAGLYANPTKIGLEKGWEAELLRCNVELRGHRLIKRTATRDSTPDENTTAD
ncbi:DNA phosphorothioation-associated putative methyltransferase [Rhodococcus aetherivorans]|uniref:DNA phosphorothioation-associated putative methyltransferase n=1 Tax=Rhodococcus aetherivorans TaxID=191292 RepID=UPI001E5502F8|nr:DNA phosphorothioation-associated putative methyltransferase [Rhodococcus aetherivorans]UGQ39594.1 DNA phosphorothioation-associated putative methyltransferase [Rhodococcus aetherivorans]